MRILAMLLTLLALLGNLFVTFLNSFSPVQLSAVWLGDAVLWGYLGALACVVSLLVQIWRPVLAFRLMLFASLATLMVLFAGLSGYGELAAANNRSLLVQVLPYAGVAIVTALATWLIRLAGPPSAARPR